jgi:hypothetical protein
VSSSSRSSQTDTDASTGLRAAGTPPADGNAPVRRTVQPCPVARLTWIAVRLVDEAAQPVADEPYTIVTPDGVEHRGCTDAEGCARIDQIVAGTCRISFPNRDSRVWDPV